MKVFVVATLLRTAACAQAGSGTLHGSVSSSTGGTIIGGSIDIAIDGTHYATAPLDMTGAYNTLVTWPGVAPVSCELHSSVPGYIDQTVYRTLDDGGSVQVDFVLDQDTIFEDGFESGS